MIRIALTNIGPAGLPVKAGIPLGILVEGHADTGTRGEDIVCAGVSAIVQTAVIAVTKVAGAHQDLEQRDGYLESRITCPGERDRALALGVILQSMMLGLDEIARQYPEHVSVSSA